MLIDQTDHAAVALPGTAGCLLSIFTGAVAMAPVWLPE